MADSKISALPAATTPLAGTEVLPVVQGGTTDQVSVANLTAGRNVTMAKVAVGVASGNEKIQTNGTVRSTGDYTSNEASAATFGFTADAGPGPGAFVLAHGANTTTRGTFRVILRASNGTATTTQLVPFTIDNAGDTAFAVGNVAFSTAAKGVNFTANTPAAGMTSQLLNWYEEGTFTPAIEGETTNPTVGYSTQYGAYTRIGRMVNFSIRLTLSSLSGGSGNVKIVGLPFTAGLSNNPYACAMEVSGVTFGAGLTSISYRPLSGQTWGRLNQFGSGAAATATTIAQLSSTADIIISGAYMV